MSEETCSSILASSLRLVVLTHGQMPTFTWPFFYNVCDGTEFRSFWLKSIPLCCLMFLRIFLPLRQSWPSNLVREDDRPFRLWPFPLSPKDGRSSLKLHESNTIPLSSPRKLSFLFDSWRLLLFPKLRSRLWNFKFSSIWSIWRFADVFNRNVNNSAFLCFEQFSWSYKANAVWSWTEFS